MTAWQNSSQVTSRSQAGRGNRALHDSLGISILAQQLRLARYMHEASMMRLWICCRPEAHFELLRSTCG